MVSYASTAFEVYRRTVGPFVVPANSVNLILSASDSSSF